MRFRQTMLLLVAVLAAACGVTDESAGGAAGTEPPATEPAATEPAATEPAGGENGATVAVESSDLGDILVDGEGRTLYLLTADEQGASTCYDDCESNWPPLEGTAQAGAGADDSLLAVVDRDDGTQQATYNDWPLYYFAGDAQAGDVNGQGVGGVWFVVTADGEPVEEGGDDDKEDPEY
ncbi:MAG: hypothetical protein GEU74_03250 [Nitriliruptorales bacterium]|nr:hypothetical protein [Nitriliruptorales bacterium]